MKKTIKYILSIWLFTLGAVYSQEEAVPEPQNEIPVGEPEKEVSQPIEEAPLEYTPLEKMRPMDVKKKIANKTSIDFGLATSSTFYSDSSLDNPLILGFYRPYFRLGSNQMMRVTFRPKILLKNFLGAPADLNKNTTSGAIELFSMDIFPSVKHKFTLGRQYLHVGKGLVFSNFADGLVYNGLISKYKIKAFVMHSGHYSDSTCIINIQGCGENVENPYNVLPGMPVDTQSALKLEGLGSRMFTGGEIEFAPSNGSTFYISVLYSRDLIKYGDSATQNTYSYNPAYFAPGMKGFIVIPELRYHTEFVLEGGSSSATDPNTLVMSENPILAYAFLADFMYAIPQAQETFKPNLLMQFAFASGDEDKRSVTFPTTTNTVGADMGFYSFGSYSGGIGLKPYLSNLFVFRTGFTVKPGLKSYFTRNMTAIFKYSYYSKWNALSPISDERAISHLNYIDDGILSDSEIADLESKKSVGSGIDITLLWKMRSELGLYYNLGVFLPGAAFPEGTETGIVNLLSVSLSF